MSATATAEATARKSAAGRIDIVGNQTDAGTPHTRPAQLETLTDEERARLWAESKDDDDFTAKAIAYGKLTGDYTIDRHIRPQRTGAEIDADIMRLQAANPERGLTSEQIRAKYGRTEEAQTAGRRVEMAGV
ncbi:hypothetical protein R80B4_02366 [Fibrobacteres bacterium R8-0-B4]